MPSIMLARDNRLFFIAGTLALLGLLLLAVLADVLRRRIQKKRLVRAEWRRVEDIATAKGIAGKDLELLRAVIARHAPREPLRTVTTRQQFDACVEAELARLDTRTSSGDYEQAGVRLRDLRTRLGLDFVPYGQRIHSTRELSPGQSLWIAPGSNSRADWFRTRIVEVDEAHFAATPWARGSGSPPSFAPEEAVRCHTWRDDDARYGFTVKLARFEDTPPIWVFHHSATLQRTQSREFYRLRIDQPTTVQVLDTRSTRDPATLHAQPVLSECSATITNLSGGGLALVLKEAIPAQSVLRVLLKLPGEPSLQVHIRVVGVDPITRQRHRLRGGFLDIDDDTRDSIARYIVQRQQLLLASEDKTGEGTG